MGVWDWVFIIAGILVIAVNICEIVNVSWTYSEAYSLLSVIGWSLLLARYFFK